MTGRRATRSGPARSGAARLATAALAAVTLALGACATGRGGEAAEDVEPVAGRGGGTASGLPDGAGAPPDADAPRRVDFDADLVDDGVDDCPDTPRGRVVDDTGCALFAGALRGVVFAPSDHRLGAAAREALLALVSDLEAHPQAIVRLEGHTDNRGTAAANLELSKRRVMSVARFLVSSGISPSRLEPYGYGESRPVAGNATEAGRERNRRIEIEQVLPPDAAPPLPSDVPPDAPSGATPDA